MTLACTAIVLAAGHGTRMGGPKALLRLPGTDRLLLEAHLEVMHAVGIAAVRIVVRTEVAETLARSASSALGDAVMVCAETPEPAASLGAAVREMGSAIPAVVFVTPVDMVPARASTYRVLLDAIDGGAAAATPSFLGRGGHPVACRSDVLAPYTRSLVPLRDVLQRLGAERARVEVDDEAVTQGLDTPEDFRARYGTDPTFRALR